MAKLKFRESARRAIEFAIEIGLTAQKLSALIDILAANFDAPDASERHLVVAQESDIESLPPAAPPKKRKGKAKVRGSRAELHARIAAAIEADPSANNIEIAAICDCSFQTVRQHRKRLEGNSPADQRPPAP